VKLTAVAVDNTGNTRTSSPIPVQVSDPPSLIVSKGPGHTILMPTASVFGPLSLEYSASGPSGPWHHLDGPYNPGGGSLGWSDGIDVTSNQRFYRLVLEQP